MSKGENFIIASGVGAIIVAILPIPKVIAYPIAGLLFMLFIFLIYKGLSLKPAKQAEISKGLFVIEEVRYKFGSPNVNGYPQSQNRRILMVDVLFHAIPSRDIESLQLKLVNRLIDFGEQPFSVGGNVLTDGGNFYFSIPDSIRKGKYTVHLIAYSRGEEFEFNPFEIEIPK